MPQLKEISSTNGNVLALHQLLFRERGSCNGSGRIISLTNTQVNDVNAVIGEINVRNGQRNIISRTFKKGEVDIGCSLNPNGDGISRQVNWAYGDTNYLPGNVDDPYDSIVIVRNPTTGSRYVYNLHARNATIAIRRAANGKHYQYLIGPGHANGLALFPNDTVTFAAWNAALFEKDETYQRRREAVETESARTIAIAKKLTIRKGENHGELGTEQILSVKTDGPVNIVLNRFVAPEKKRFTRCTLDAGDYIIGYSLDEEGRKAVYTVEWAYGDTNYFPRDPKDPYEAIIVVKDTNNLTKSLWNLWPEFPVGVDYWSESEKREKHYTLAPNQSLPLGEGDFVRGMAFGF